MVKYDDGHALFKVSFWNKSAVEKTVAVSYDAYKKMEELVGLNDRQWGELEIRIKPDRGFVFYYD